MAAELLREAKSHAERPGALDSALARCVEGKSSCGKRRRSHSEPDFNQFQWISDGFLM